MIEFANGFDGVLQLLIIGEPAAHFLNPLTAHAELTRTSARIGHRQTKDLMHFAARAFRTSRAWTVLSNNVPQQLAGDRQFADQLVACPEGLPTNHSQE